ncbi:MAG TPA: glycosyltransferase [Terracidiphilus sp.]|nr:glycosyltransferase [Terracidiphilus sp.]
MDSLHTFSMFWPFLRAIDHSPLYAPALIFYGLYPIAMSWLWIILSLFFRHRQEVKPLVLDGDLPMVSVIVPCYAEGATLKETIEALLALNYPSFEVIIVNDCSPDDTADVARSFISDPRVRLLNKTVNEGKAMGLNDALPLCRGEILLIVDADIIVTPDILYNLVPHFLGTRVAAVTGNPRVRNRTSLLQHLQAIEFASIVSMQRRAQRVLGRILTVSGAVVAVRRTALLDLGGFSPQMATEDMDLTWRLQMHFWDIRYEPRAVVWMQVPLNLRDLWRQRRRWTRGLAQSIRRHRRIPFRWKMRRMWPIFYESCASILWAYIFVLMTSYWVFSKCVGYAPRGASPIPNFWGMMIATTCIAQLLIGAWMDRKYDPKILGSIPASVFYPIVYWMMMAVITFTYSLPALLRAPPKVQTWRIRRRLI